MRPTDFQTLMDGIAKMIIDHILVSTNGNQKAAAKILRTHREQIWRKLQDKGPKRDCGWLYVLTDGSGYYKIGHSHRNPEWRRKASQTGNPRRVVIVRKYPIDDPVAAEKELHELFSERRGRGEWFKLTAEDLELIERKYGG